MSGVLPSVCFHGCRRSASQVKQSDARPTLSSQPRDLTTALPRPRPHLPPPVPAASALSPLHPRAPRPQPGIPACPSSRLGAPGGLSKLNVDRTWKVTPTSPAHTPAASQARDLRIPIRSGRLSPTSAAETSPTLSKGDESR